MAQKQLIFFQPDSPPPPASLVKWELDPKNSASPYYGYIGNAEAVRRLIRIDFAAKQRYNHFCGDMSLAFIGRAGCGKTALAKRHAKATGLPWVEVSAPSVNSSQEIFEEIKRVCEENDLPLVEVNRPDHYVIPPICVFIDEVHSLKKSIVQILLKATEAGDSTWTTEKGYVVDCQYIHWMIATTDRGLLFDAFDTRFSKVSLSLYSKDEIAQIVAINHPDWPEEACNLVAHYRSRMPRVALEFAREMELEHNMSGGTWEEAAHVIAKDNRIDEHGMPHDCVAVLNALENGPVASKRLPVIVGVKPEELEKFILPYLLESTSDQDAFVGVSSRGYTLTKAGKFELEKRKSAA